MRGLLIVALLSILSVPSFARETELPAVPRHAPAAVHTETYNKLSEVPYDFAKNFPDELYYWWAKSFNERSYRLAAESRRPAKRTAIVTESTTEYNSTTPGGNFWYQYGGDSRGQIDQRTFQRAYESRSGGLPAMIYNPYCRENKQDDTEAKEEGDRPRIQATDARAKKYWSGGNYIVRYEESNNVR